jgi:hypothetical protein
LRGTWYAAGCANDGRDGDARFADIDDGPAAAALEYPRIEEEEDLTSPPASGLLGGLKLLRASSSARAMVPAILWGVMLDVFASTPKKESRRTNPPLRLLPIVARDAGATYELVQYKDALALLLSSKIWPTFRA